MQGTITLTVEVSDEAELAALRDTLVDTTVDSGEEVLAWGSAIVGDERSFTVWGVDTSTGEPFSQVVTAPDANAAIEAATVGDHVAVRAEPSEPQVGAEPQ